MEPLFLDFITSVITYLNSGNIQVLRARRAMNLVLLALLGQQLRLLDIKIALMIAYNFI